ncbi:hypothetical protein F511_47419 [Dorcoceras hygrometricum]|uniref:Uncharacterized protein n=1 Tax=Dorcoceras hygrometricum TaxID=472368 RepID=A0A2Z6ZR56_9LAMI|nr:hypothetical protein F511_47419 [Dorcoceras hygrometricum]
MGTNIGRCAARLPRLSCTSAAAASCAYHACGAPRPPLRHALAARWRTKIGRSIAGRRHWLCAAVLRAWRDATRGRASHLARRCAAAARVFAPVKLWLCGDV